MRVQCIESAGGVTARSAMMKDGRNERKGQEET
jgi:hypothetical protein